MTANKAVIIGGGPAGLTAGYLLAKRGEAVTVLEAHPTRVGGISRTEEHNGYHFDIGGHRFFSKSKAVEDLWTELLPDDLLQRPRSSRILYGGKFYSYPLRPLEAFWNLGATEAFLCACSFARAKIAPVRDPRSLEEWVSNQFGRRLYGIFFKTYTEKVWGIPCSELSADWAAQRIKGLSLFSAVFHALTKALPKRREGKVIKTLIESFRYPRRGPGMLWEACASRIEGLGGRLLRGARAVAVERRPGDAHWTVLAETATGQRVEVIAEHVISSAPLRELAVMAAPHLPASAVEAARTLKYRDFVTAALMVEGAPPFEDNWIYIHEPSVRVGRIQNYTAWSPEMVPAGGAHCYGLEYFCNQGDDFWSMADEAILDLARAELSSLFGCAPESFVDGAVVRQPKAYPVYDDGYADRVAVIRAGIEALPNFHVVGRNGMHKYNNQDHSMMTAMLTVENILAGNRRWDVWKVNQDAEYHEAGTAAAQ